MMCDGCNTEQINVYDTNSHAFKYCDTCYMMCKCCQFQVGSVKRINMYFDCEGAAAISRFMRYDFARQQLWFSQFSTCIANHFPQHKDTLAKYTVLI